MVSASVSLYINTCDIHHTVWYWLEVYPHPTDIGYRLLKVDTSDYEPPTHWHIVCAGLTTPGMEDQHTMGCCTVVLSTLFARTFL